MHPPTQGAMDHLRGSMCSSPQMGQQECSVPDLERSPAQWLPKTERDGPEDGPRGWPVPNSTYCQLCPPQEQHRNPTIPVSCRLSPSTLCVVPAD